MYSYSNGFGNQEFNNAPNQLSANQGFNTGALELSPEVQQAVLNYMKGLNSPTPMSSTDRIEISVPASTNKATSYNTNQVDSYIQQQEAFAHSVGITDTPVANGKGVQMSRSYSLPAYSATQLPMNAPTPQQYLGQHFENSIYIPNYG